MSQNIYYSQHGEDFLLNKLLDKQTGFFVEVGCIDGLRFSNTLFFEKLGWKGICIEAHNDYIELLEENRPNSTIVHCAIGDKDKDEVTFYANSRGSLSSLDKSSEERWRKDYIEDFSGFVEQVVTERTLTSVFDQFKIGEIDILSIDIEGYEIPALEGLDFSKYRPNVLIVESDNKDHKNRITELLNDYGYYFLCDFGGNLFFSINKSDRKIICNKSFDNIRLLHTQHPLDNCGDKEFLRTVKTHDSNSFRYRFKKKINSLFSKSLSNLNKDSREISEFINVGFHGDEYLIKVIDECCKDVTQFVETGTNVGSTLHYFALKYQNIQCFSCEPHLESYALAKSKINNLNNVIIKNIISPDFLHQCLSEKMYAKNTVFWLDSHGYGFTWPLKEEIEFITDKFETGYIFIDDFKVPDQLQFAYDEYDNQVCDWDFIKDSLKQKRDYLILYPKYDKRTSKIHPLRGWVLIVFGANLEYISNHLGKKFSNLVSVEMVQL